MWNVITPVYQYTVKIMKIADAGLQQSSKLLNLEIVPKYSRNNYKNVIKSHRYH